jgi:hypothetical protein
VNGARSLALEALANRLDALKARAEQDLADFKRWQRQHPSAPRSTACSRMSRAREQSHWRRNRKRWLRRHDIWPPHSGPLILFCRLQRIRLGKLRLQT